MGGFFVSSLYFICVYFNSLFFMWFVVCVRVPLPSVCDGFVHVSTAGLNHRLNPVQYVYYNGSFCSLWGAIVCSMTNSLYSE